MKRVTILLLTLIVAMPILHAVEMQSTVVVGQVYDSNTFSPLENIHLSVHGKSVGTTTNAEGMFLLRLEISRPTKVVVSGIGYRSYSFVVNPGVDAGIDVALQEKNTLLEEVMVTPGTNPASALMARVRANRSLNESPVMTTDNSNAQTQVFLSEIQSRHLSRKVWKNMQSSLIAQSDSSYLLPIYTRVTREGEQDVHASVLTEEEYANLLTELETAPNFYRNTFSLYSTAFLSPLASDGSAYYRFYLLDSICAATGKQYIVDFRTRNPYYATFDGQMVIDSATAGLIRITAVVPPQVNANYLKNATIEQDFQQTDDGRLGRSMQHSRVNLLLDVAVKTDNSHTFPSVLVTHEMSHRNSPLAEVNHFRESNLHSDSAPLPSVSDLQVKIDTLNNTPLFRTARFLAYTISTGYIPTGSYVEIGNVSELLKVNNQETIRLGLPLRTSEKLWKNVCLEAYAAYGFSDQAWKGAGAVHINLPTQRRHQLTIRYADEYRFSDISDFEMLKRENASWFRYMGFTTAITRIMQKQARVDYNPMVREREFRLLAEDDWTDYLETTTKIAVGRMGYGEPTHNYHAQPSFRYANLSTTLRFSWEEKKVDMYFRRIHVYNNLPVLYLFGEIGSFTMDNAQSTSAYHLYGQLHLMLRHQIHFGVAGQLDYLLEGGLILGKVPYPLLQIFDANPTFAYDQYRFSLMPNYKFAADRYVAFHADWNGRGCLFNLIPGIRYLHLRELAVFKLGYGGLSAHHNEVLPLPLSRNNEPCLEALNTPYIELGVGIGNILRIGEIYSIWRLTHNNDIPMPRWSLHFRFCIDK